MNRWLKGFGFFCACVVCVLIIVGGPLGRATAKDLKNCENCNLDGADLCGDFQFDAVVSMLGATWIDGCKCSDDHCKNCR